MKEAHDLLATGPPARADVEPESAKQADAVLRRTSITSSFNRQLDPNDLKLMEVSENGEIIAERGKQVVHQENAIEISSSLKDRSFSAKSAKSAGAEKVLGAAAAAATSSKEYSLIDLETGFKCTVGDSPCKEKDKDMPPGEGHTFHTTEYMKETIFGNSNCEESFDDFTEKDGTILIKQDLTCTPNKNHHHRHHPKKNYECKHEYTKGGDPKSCCCVRKGTTVRGFSRQLSTCTFAFSESVSKALLTC